MEEDINNNTMEEEIKQTNDKKMETKEEDKNTTNNKVEEKTELQKKEDIIKLQQSLSDELEVGDIKMSSPIIDLVGQANLLMWLLGQPEIREYLDIIKTKRMNGGAYVG